MKITEILSRDEMNALAKPSNVRGFLALATTWGMIGGSFALVTWTPSFLTVLIALIILGGRHLALAILMHDASHYSLFRTRSLNQWIGSWLCAYPTWQDLTRYREHHLRHHLYAGNEKDPDVSLIEGFPLTRASLVRKFIRDLTGISGIKRIYGLLLMDLGYIGYTVAADVRPIPQEGRTVLDVLKTGAKNLKGVLITNSALLGILSVLGHPELYLLWVVSYLTFFSLFVRIRSIAEHACTDRDLDPFRSTRTTEANPLARVTVAPHYVNYHLEHHLLMTVPNFRLPVLHRILKEKGILDKGAYYARGYLEVLKISTRS